MSFIFAIMLIIPIAFLLTACSGGGATSSNILFNSNFENGNAGVFTAAENVEITDNDDSTITIGKAIQKGAFIKFETKEIVTTWNREGYTTSITFYIDLTTIGHGELFEITSAVNGKDNKYLTESVVTFQKVNDKMTIAAWDGSSKSLVNETINTSGWYTLDQSFYGKAGQLFVDIKIINEDNKTVLISTGKLNHVEYGTENSETWHNGCSEELIKDMRYIWICNQQLKNGLTIKNVQLLKN